MKMQKYVIFVKKNLKINMWKIKNIVKLEIFVIIHRNIEVLHIACVIQSFSVITFSVPKKSTIDFHNGSNYDFHFIIKVLAEEFKKQFFLFWRKH